MWITGKYCYDLIQINNEKIFSKGRLSQSIDGKSSFNLNHKWMYTIFSSYTQSLSKERNVPWNFKSSGDLVLIIPASIPTSIKDLKHFMENQKISIDLLSIHVESVVESFYLNEVVECEGAGFKTKAV